MPKKKKIFKKAPPKKRISRQKAQKPKKRSKRREGPEFFIAGSHQLTIDISRSLGSRASEKEINDVTCFDEHGNPHKFQMVISCDNQDDALRIYERYQSTSNVIVLRKPNSISKIWIIPDERVKQLLREMNARGKIKDEETPGKDHKPSAKKTLLLSGLITTGTLLAGERHPFD